MEHQYVVPKRKSCELQYLSRRSLFDNFVLHHEFVSVELIVIFMFLPQSYGVLERCHLAEETTQKEKLLDPAPCHWVLSHLPHAAAFGVGPYSNCHSSHHVLQI